MTDNAYRRLANHLDKLPGGYPSTESGVELRILKRLFTEDQARLAVHLTMKPEPAAPIAERAVLGVDTCGQLLKEMEQKGLLFSMEKHGETRYMAAQFVVGIWEYNVNSLDQELIRDVNEYLPELMDGRVWKDAPQLRTIPIGESVPIEHQAFPYELAEQLVEGKRKYLVAPCICRKEHTMMGEGCGKPEEACLIFDAAADFYEKRGIGRVIDKEETLQILNLAEQHGLVLQPSNAKETMSICLCCGCCCQVLKMLKRQPRPADSFTSPFVVDVVPGNCTGCELCVQRCPMDALAMVDGHAVPDTGRCIGCGLCVTSCPAGALVMKRSDSQPTVPENARQNLKNIVKTRIKVTRRGSC